MAGDDTLDPQYFERPDDLSDADRIRYFDPVELTDARGGPADWLKPYVPATATPAVHPVVLSSQPVSEAVP